MLQKMQINPEKHTVQRLQVPAKPLSITVYESASSQACLSNTCVASSPRPHHVYTRSSSYRGCVASSPRPQNMCTRSSSYRSRSVRGGGRPEIPVPTNKLLRRKQADKEVLRRALTPPIRRQSRRRWWDFRPTPSRLCNMSMAY